MPGLLFCDTWYITYFVPFLLFLVLDIIHLTEGPFFSTIFVCMIWVTTALKRHTLTSSQITQHHVTSLVRHIIPGTVMVCYLVVQCMIVWLTSTKCLIHMHSQFSVVLSFYGPARRSTIKYVKVDYCSRFSRQWRTGHVQR